jgi:mannose-1-phosphate guanylyltransferase
MLQSTVDLLEGLVPIERAVVVTGQRYAEMVRSQLPHLPPENLLVEPRALNTAPAMAVATALIKGRHPEAVVVNLPSDHYVGQAAEFRNMITVAATAAAAQPIIVVVGVEPASASIGFGYIERGDAVMSIDKSVIYRVRSFVEKPSQPRAQAFIESGRYLWNANYYTFHVDTFEAALAAHVPSLSGLIWPDEATRGAELMRELYRTAPSISIDYAMTQRAGNICVLPASFNWSDLGDWDQLYAVLASFSADRLGNVVVAPNTRLVLTVDSSRNLIIQIAPRPTVLVGVTDSIVADIGEGLLVARRDDVQQLQAVVAQLAAVDDRYL